MVNCSIQKCTNCRKTGHLIGECPDIRCNFCQGKGHMKGECPRNGPEPSQRRFPMIYRSSINQAVENLANQIVSDIPKHVEYAWRGKDGVVHDTNETNWENNWPKCINCGKVAYISNHADKPKCYYYYNVEPGKDTHLCQDCLSEYGEKDQFSGYDDIFVCKRHNGCLVFASKMAKKRFDNDDYALEEFEELKENQQFSEAQPNLNIVDGGWNTSEDIFDRVVQEEASFDPNSFEFQCNVEVQKAQERWNNQQQSLKGKEKEISIESADQDIEITKRVLDEYKFMVDEISKERTNWKRKYEIVDAQNEYHKQQIVEINEQLTQSQPQSQDLIAAWGKINQLVEENNQLKSTIKTLEPQAESAVESLALQFETVDLEMTVDIMKNDLERSKEINDRHLETINRQQKVIQNIVDENAELDSRITQLKINVDKIIQAGLMVINEKETLENKLVRYDKVMENYHNMLRENRTKRDEMTEAYDALRRENFMLKNDIEISNENQRKLVEGNEKLIKKNQKRKLKELLKFGRKKNKN